MSATAKAEQRFYARGRLGATALVKLDERVGWYLVRNLSAGGALLSDGPLLTQGADVKMVLQIPGSVPWALDATVCRIELDVDGVAQAIKFRDLLPETERMLDAEARAASRHLHGPEILVIGSDVRLLGTLASEISRLGRQTILACGPIDAFRCLHDPTGSIDAVAVVGSPTSSLSLSLLASVRKEFPGMRRVLLSEKRPEQLALIDSTIDYIVAQPWSASALCVAFPRLPVT